MLKVVAQLRCLALIEGVSYLVLLFIAAVVAIIISIYAVVHIAFGPGLAGGDRSTGGSSPPEQPATVRFQALPKGKRETKFAALNGVCCPTRISPSSAVCSSTPGSGGW